MLFLDVIIQVTHNGEIHGMHMQLHDIMSSLGIYKILLKSLLDSDTDSIVSRHYRLRAVDEVKSPQNWPESF